MRRKRKPEITKICNERGDITTNIAEIKSYESTINSHIPSNWIILIKWTNSQKQPTKAESCRNRKFE